MIVNNTAAVKQQVQQRTVMALQEAAAAIGALAVSRAPILEGWLRNSLILSYSREGDLLRAAIAFNTVYAARQHEETTWRHKQGQAKYLSSAAEDRADYVRKVFENHLRSM